MTYYNKQGLQITREESEDLFIRTSFFDKRTDIQLRKGKKRLFDTPLTEEQKKNNFRQKTKETQYTHRKTANIYITSVIKE